MRGRHKAEYIVYDNETTLPVFLGAIEECAAHTGLTVYTIRTMMSKGIEDRKYSFYNVDELLKDYNDEVM